MALSRDLADEHAAIDRGIEAFVGGLKDGQPSEADLTAAFELLRRHIYFEEEMLFPPLQQAGLLPPLVVMRREHGELWKMMGLLVAALEVGSSAPQVEELLGPLMAQLQEHNHKEEMIVYPAAEQMIPASSLEVLSSDLGQAEMPQGWVCEQAR